MPYYYDFYPSSDGTLTETGLVRGKYSGYAAYVNLAYDITERLNVEVGVRYTNDDKEFSTLVPEPESCLLYTSPSPRDATLSRMPSSA